MVILLIGFLWFLNLGISIWNAYATGKAWVEAKHSGGWTWAMCWAGAAMSAIGFTWCYAIFLALVATALGWLDMQAMEAFLSLTYIVLVPGLLVSGTMIMVDSWARAYRERTIANVGLAGYNTFANLYNTYNAVSGLGDAFKEVGNFFGDVDGDSAAFAIVVLLLVIALGGGILTTGAIIKRSAATEPLERVYQRASLKYR